MASLHALLLTLTLAGSADVTLLDFYSPQCGPCRSMVPAIQRLEAGGYAVRKIDVSREPELARRFGVRAVPCFVLMAGGRELDRVEGATSYEHLQAMLARAGAGESRAAEPVRYRAQSPDQIAARPNPASPAPARGATATNAPPATGQVPAAIEALARRALHATVRLRVEDAEGQSWGTGTIIDRHGDEALVVTCGHIFRDSQGRGKIMVELFAPGASGPVPGELIAYDADERDIGLVSVRLNTPVEPVRVGGTRHRSFRGDRVFSIGCNHGQDPTIRHSHVTAVNKYVGPANVEVAGQPVDGRSGGGLFAADGSLIGVCNAADPQDDEGIYAALNTIHWQLAQVGQQRVFAPENPNQEIIPRGPKAFLVDQTAPNGSSSASASTTPAAGTRGSGTPALGTEVLCIIRTKDRPDGQVIVVDDAALIQQLLDASKRRDANGSSVTESSGPIIRAQSEDNHPAYRRR